MNMISLKTTTALLACVSVVACGGGGDDNAGSLTALSVAPSELTVTGAANSCDTGTSAVGAQAVIMVSGGAAPYHIHNSFPSAISIDKTTVDSRNGTFTVTFQGMCVDPATVVVTDANDRQATLTLTNTDS